MALKINEYTWTCFYLFVSCKYNYNCNSCLCVLYTPILCISGANDIVDDTNNIHNHNCTINSNFTHRQNFATTTATTATIKDIINSTAKATTVTTVPKKFITIDSEFTGNIDSRWGTSR